MASSITLGDQALRLDGVDQRMVGAAQYHDLAAGKGVVHLFKPSAVADTTTIKLRGVDPAKRYRVSFEDGTNPAVEKTGEELASGLAVTLKSAPVSELVWIEEIR